MLLCFGKDCCASGKFLVFWKRLLCSRVDCCVLEKIVVFSKRLLCSSKDCCVSEQELSCVLPVWATVIHSMLYYKEVLHNYMYFIHVPSHKNMHWPTRSNKTYATHDGRVDCNTIFKFIVPSLYSDWLHFLWHGMKWFIFEWSIEKHKKYQTKPVKGQAMVRHLPLYA